MWYDNILLLHLCVLWMGTLQCYGPFLTPRAEVSYAQTFMCASVMFVVRKIVEKMNCIQQTASSSTSLPAFYGPKIQYGVVCLWRVPSLFRAHRVQFIYGTLIGVNWAGCKEGQVPLQLFSACEYIFWLLSWRGANKSGWEGCMYIKDWFKPNFPLFLTWLLCKVPIHRVDLVPPLPSVLLLCLWYAFLFITSIYGQVGPGVA